MSRSLNSRSIVLAAIGILVAACGDGGAPDAPLQQLVYQENYLSDSGRIVQVSIDGTGRKVLFDGPSFGPLFVAPDNRILFQVTGGWRLLPANGGAAVPFTAPSTYDQAEGPYWAPDGLSLAWVIADQSGVHLAIAAPGSSTYQVITPDSLAVYRADWSPDGTQLVFMAANTNAGVNRYYTVTSTGTGLHQLTPDSIQPGGYAAWSPDGSRIAFVADDQYWSGDVWIIAPDGTDIRRLTENTVTDHYRYALGVHWSPDNLELIGPSSPSGSFVRINVASGQQTANGVCCSPPFNPWSPDGSHLLYLISHYVNRFDWTARVGVALPDGTGGTQVGADLPSGNPVWLSKP